VVATRLAERLRAVREKVFWTTPIYYYVLLLHSYSVKNPWLASAKRRLSHPPGLRFNVLKGVPKLEIYMMATEFLNVVGGIRHIFSRNR